MKIARVEMLFLVWALPVLFLFFLYGMRRRRRILGCFASPRGLAAIVPEQGSKRRRIKAGLILASLLWAAVALSGPQYGYRWQALERKGIDIVIALDCSRSMLARDIPPSRLDRAKREVYDLLGLLRGDRIGLVAFAGTAFLQCPLTLDYGAFHLFLETLTPDYLPVGGSDIGAALAAAASAFDAEGSREKTVILITDGENTGVGDPLKAAEEARDAGIRLFCIGVGTGDGVPVPAPEGGFMKDSSGRIVVSRLDEETLKRAAVSTGGTYVKSIAGDMDLDVVYTREIRGNMEMETLESGRRQVWEDRYQWALFLAAAALFAEICLPSVKGGGRVAGGVLMIFLLLATAGPASADAFRDGVSAYREKDYEAALKHFIDAQLDAPDDPEILYNLGNAYYRAGDFDLAAGSFESAAASGDARIRHDALFNLGNANFRRQDYRRAVENYAAVLKMDPDDRLAAENMEVARRMMERQEQQEQQEQQERQERQEWQEQQQGQDRQESPSNGPEGRRENPAPSDAGKNKAEGATAPPEPRPDARGGAEGKRAPLEGADPGGETAGSGGQAERMLNRLKDAPGRALMPDYRKRRVDRDW